MLVTPSGMRVKLSGARWAQANVNQILSLRCAYLNGVLILPEYIFQNGIHPTLFFCILPFFSKVGFSFLDLHGLRGLQNRQSETGLDRATDRILQFLGMGIPATRSSGNTRHRSAKL